MFEVREEPFGYEPLDLSIHAPLKRPHSIMIDPSGSCNFKCCFCPCNNAKEHSDVRHTIMSTSTFNAVLEGLKRFPETVPIIDLYGLGEPLMNPRFCEMAAALKYANVCQIIRTTTNASLLDATLVQSLVESGIDYVKISIEGLNEEQYLRTCGVKVDYSQLLANIEHLYNASRGKLQVGIKIVSSAFTSAEDRQYYLDLFSPISDYTYVRNVQLNWAEFDEMRFPADIPDGKFCNNKVPSFDTCSYPLTHMIVHSNGDIGLCCYDWKHATSYANVNTMPLDSAWRSKQLYLIRLAHLQGRRSDLPFCCNCIRKGYDNIDSYCDTIVQLLKRDALVHGLNS